MAALVPIVILCAALAAPLALAAPAWGLSASGRLTTSLYGYEGADADGGSATHLRAYQGARLDLGDLGLAGLSFHTYLRATTDVADQADSDPRLQVYAANLDWKRQGTRLQLGRQRIQAGVGYGSIDGLRADASYAGLGLTAYAGALVPLNTSTDISSFGAAHLWGLRLSTERFLGTSVALSFADRERDPEPFDQPGQYSGLVGDRPAVKRRLVGLDAYRQFARGHSLRGRLDADLHAGSLRRAEVGGRYQICSDLGLELGYMRREPSVYYNSVLSVFDAEGYQEIEARLHYRLSPDLGLSGSAAALFYDGADAQRLGITASLGSSYTLGYYRSMGYAGANDGLVGSLYYPVSRRLVLRGQLDLAAYERYEDADERDGLVTGALGATYRPSRTTSLDLQLQGLRNPTHTSDLRVFVRGSWRFFRG
ncbi:MAG: hypothetical protein ABIL09_27025 [Gemmatimonadota bacterium]